VNAAFMGMGAGLILPVFVCRDYIHSALGKVLTAQE
jgi:hypothetical protein